MYGNYNVGIFEPSKRDQKRVSYYVYTGTSRI